MVKLVRVQQKLSTVVEIWNTFCDSIFKKQVDWKQIDNIFICFLDKLSRNKARYL